MRLALTPIVERLREAGVLRVEGVLEFSARSSPPPVMPAHFVVPVAESAAGNAQDVGRDQAVDVTLSVMIVVNGARRNQAGISEELKACEDQVLGALVGWTHPDASRPCSYVGGHMTSADGSAVVWELRLRTRYHDRRAS